MVMTADKHNDDGTSLRSTWAVALPSVTLPNYHEEGGDPDRRSLAHVFRAGEPLSGISAARRDMTFLVDQR